MKPQESRIYFEEPSQTARSIALSWGNVIDTQVEARLSPFQKLAAGFSRKHVDALREIVAEEIAARIERQLNEAEKEGTHPTTVPPPPIERIKTEEKMRPLFLAAIKELQSDNWRAGCHDLDSIYQHAAAEGRDIFKSWVNPVLRLHLSRLTRKRDDPQQFFIAIEALDAYAWVDVTHFSDIASMVLKEPALYDMLKKNLVNSASIVSLYVRMASLIRKIGLGAIVEKLRPESQAVALDMLLQLLALNKSDDFLRLCSGLIQSGVFTDDEMRTNEQLLKRAGGYLIRRFAKDPFDYTAYGAEASKLSDRIAERRYFDKLPEIRPYIDKERNNE